MFIYKWPIYGHVVVCLPYSAIKSSQAYACVCTCVQYTKNNVLLVQVKDENLGFL